MDRKTQITRRNALALTALAVLLGRKAEAAPVQSAVQRLSDRLAREVAEGRLTYIRLMTGPGWAGLPTEKRAQAVLDCLDAKPITHFPEPGLRFDDSFLADMTPAT